MGLPNCDICGKQATEFIRIVAHGDKIVCEDCAMHISAMYQQHHEDDEDGTQS